MRNKDQTELDEPLKYKEPEEPLKPDEIIEVGSVAQEKEKNANRKLYVPAISFKDLRVILGLSYSSRLLEQIVVQPGRVVDGQLVFGEPRILNRPYLHVFVQAPKGSYKSAHADALRRLFGDTVTSQDYTTYAGLRGSITEEGEFVSPLLYSWAKKLAIMDEVVRDRHGEFTRMLLQILEGRDYTYKLGRVTKDFDSTTTIEGAKIFKDTGAYYKVKDSNVSVFAPFTLVMLSMYPLTHTLSSQLGQAQLDRMLIAAYVLHDEERGEVEDGLYKFEFPIYQPSTVVQITLEEYVRIKELRASLMRNKNPEFSQARILDNMIRVYAVVKGVLALDSAEILNLFELVTRVSGAYWMDTAPVRKQYR